MFSKSKNSRHSGSFSRFILVYNMRTNFCAGGDVGRGRGLCLYIDKDNWSGGETPPLQCLYAQEIEYPHKINNRSFFCLYIDKDNWSGGETPPLQCLYAQEIEYPHKINNRSFFCLLFFSKKRTVPTFLFKEK